MKNSLSNRQIIEEFEQFEDPTSAGKLQVVIVDKHSPNRRSTWIGGCNLHRAFAEMVQATKNGCLVYVFLKGDLRELNEGESQWDIARYREAAEKFDLNPYKFGCR